MERGKQHKKQSKAPPKAASKTFSAPALALGLALEKVGAKYKDNQLKQRGKRLQKENPLPKQKPQKRKE